MESWDPMALDHQSREFNSYKSGAGALMQAARDRGGGGGGGGGGGTINLFITNIPVEVTKVYTPLNDISLSLSPLSLL